MKFYTRQIKSFQVRVGKFCDEWANFQFELSWSLIFYHFPYLGMANK